MAEETRPPSDPPREELRGETQLFTIAFNPNTSEVAFLGSMPTEQALALIQQVLHNRETARLRQEIEAELKSSKRASRDKSKKAH